jgi:hypothetical protein
MRFASTLASLLLAVPAFGQVTTRASVDTAGGDSNHNSQYPSVSADGSLVAFYSFASDLVANDKNGAYDVFVRDVANGVTERVSVDSGGGEANSSSWFPAISADRNGASRSRAMRRTSSRATRTGCATSSCTTARPASPSA